MEQKKKGDDGVQLAPSKKTGGRIMDVLAVAVQRQQEKLSGLNAVQGDPSSGSVKSDAVDHHYGPYKSELDYLEDQVRLMRLKKQIIVYGNRAKAPDDANIRRRRQEQLSPQEAQSAKVKSEMKSKKLAERIQTKIKNPNQDHCLQTSRVPS